MYRSDVTQPARLAASPYIIGSVWELNKCVCIAPVSEVALFHLASVHLRRSGAATDSYICNWNSQPFQSPLQLHVRWMAVVCVRITTEGRCDTSRNYTTVAGNNSSEWVQTQFYDEDLSENHCAVWLTFFSR